MPNPRRESSRCESSRGPPTRRQRWGAAVKVIQQMLGHASAAMTLDVYGRLWPSRLGEVADALEDARLAEIDPPQPPPAGAPAPAPLPAPGM
ncbi:MAG: hypothetical protein LBS27_10440 [Bifidobacteriaceae bacterium]|jgi:integrase|nr:hypothetical protein [Bifidobacteriaceae bacterium]